MADESMDLDMNESETRITSSQEQKLLDDDSNDGITVTVNAPNAAKSADTAPPGNLAGLKNFLEANANARGGELSMSLQTGVVTTIKPNRNRTTKAKSDAKRKQHSSVNPHDRIVASKAADTPKRGRESGGTPPSANQPNKKALGKPITATSDKPAKVLSKGQRYRLNKSLRKQTSATISNPNAGLPVAANAPAPPSTFGSELSGAGSSAANVIQPPVAKSQSIEPDTLPAPELGLIGSGSTSETRQQNAASSGNNDVANQHIPMEVNNDSGGNSKTYAQVTDSHCMAIIDQRQPGHMQLLDENRFNKINALLTDAIMEMIGKKVELPAFDDTRLHGGAMRIRCANGYTRKWLEANVSKLDAKKLWPGAKLVLIDYKDIPKPHKFNVFFRGILKSPKDIFSLLETQNKGVNTKSWSVLCCKHKDGGTQMTIGVAQDSFETLRANSNTLYCGMGRAVFMVVKNCKENQAAATSSTTNADDNEISDPLQQESGTNTNSEAVVTLDP